jgi:FlaA1/EpsC-like NDP-sugar epimerase
MSAQTLLSLSRTKKIAVVLCVDLSLLVLAVWLAYYLRLGEFVSLAGAALWPVLVSIALAPPILMASGLYRAIFRYSGLPAMLSLTRAILVYGVFYASAFTFVGVPDVPRTIGFIQPMLVFLLVGASRAGARLWLGGLYEQHLRKSALPKTLIYGAGSAGRQLAAALSNSLEMRAVGFVDDDERLHGHILNGLPIYSPSDLEEQIESLGVTNVLLALPSASRVRRNEIIARLYGRHVAVRTLPGLEGLAIGRVSVGALQDLDVDDLLGREAVQPNGLLLNVNTHGKRVLVTGAGGSIGSELCRQVLRGTPEKLLLVDNGEYALYNIHQELLKLETSTEIVPLLASVCDEPRMHEIMDTWRPHSVYHAAAYKHVPLVEHNPAEGIRNNVWGTKVCAETALRNGVRNFVYVSTDKAVRPTNIMGASKRLAELVLQALHHLHDQACLGGRGKKTCFSIVRFGNVLGSSGSVVPLFREQIREGGPITLTHPDVTRYFMSISEAAQLVIQSGAMGKGGDVFVLDMGEPVRILELARNMVSLSGLVVRDEENPSGDIEIKITGLRPGEKLYEELLLGNDPKPTQHPSILQASEPFLPMPELEMRLNALSVAVGASDVPLTRALLKGAIPDYQPDVEVVDWVHLEQKRQRVSD